MNTYSRVLRYLRPYTSRLAASIACSLLFSVFSGISIYLTIPLLETLFGGSGTAAPVAAVVPEASGVVPGWLTGLRESIAASLRDLVFSGSVEQSLLNICLVIVAAFLLKNLFGYIQSNLMTFIEQAVVRDLRNDLYRHMHALPLAYFTNERTGNLISRVMNDVNVVNSGISATFYTLIREPLLVVVYLGIALVLSWKLTLIAFVVFPLVLLVIAFIGRRVHRESGWVQERMAALTTVLHETITGVKVVKAFGMEEFENRKFAEENNRFFHTVLKIAKIRNLASPSAPSRAAPSSGTAGCRCWPMRACGPASSWGSSLPSSS
jgi:subfamily B ATP-binding cassette protein MsbA